MREFAEDGGDGSDWNSNDESSHHVDEDEAAQKASGQSAGSAG